MIQEWWNGLVEWFASAEGQSITLTVILPAAAILVAGILASLIAAAATGRLFRQRERADRAAAIAGLLAVVRRATVWTSLSVAEKDHIDYQTTESLVRLRLLAAPAADLVAEWAGYRIDNIKRHSATIIAEADAELVALENGLIEWHRTPSRAIKAIKSEIELLRFDAQSLDRDLIARQRQWQAEQDGRAAAPAAPSAVPAAAAPVAAAPETLAPAQRVDAGDFNELVGFHRD